MHRFVELQKFTKGFPAKHRFRTICRCERRSEHKLCTEKGRILCPTHFGALWHFLTHMQTAPIRVNGTEKEVLPAYYVYTALHAVLHCCTF
jgi:hypothetical protein